MAYSERSSRSSSLTSRELDLFERVEIEPFFRGVHGDVGAVESDGEEKGVVRFQRLDFVGGPVCQMEVRHLLIGVRERAPVPERVAVGLADLLFGAGPKPPLLPA